MLYIGYTQINAVLIKAFMVYLCINYVFRVIKLSELLG